jgi:hypothetical protein
LKTVGLRERWFECARAFGVRGRCGETEKDNAEAQRVLRFAEKTVVNWVARGTGEDRGVSTGELHRSLLNVKGMIEDFEVVVKFEVFMAGVCRVRSN